jgi:hypothetical protein
VRGGGMKQLSIIDDREEHGRQLGGGHP